MAFPNDDLDLTLEAAFGADLDASPSSWVFTDLTDRLLPSLIRTRRGIAVGAGSSANSSASGIEADNQDGWLTPNNAASPYWPYVDTGTPLRIRRRTKADLVQTFGTNVSSDWPDSDTGESWTPISNAANFSSSGGTGLITQTVINASRSIYTTRNDPDVDITFDVAVSAVSLGSANEAGVSLRCSGGRTYRLVCTVEFGISGAVRLILRRNFDSAQTILTFPTVPAMTYTGGTVIRVQVQTQGPYVRMRAWFPAGSPPAWLIDYRQTIDIVTGRNAALGPTDNIFMTTTVFSGNTNTLPLIFSFDNIAIAQLKYAVEGYIADVRPVFIPLGDGTFYSTAQIDVGGVATISEKKDASALSPMRRSIEKQANPPIAYWPGEDAQGSTFVASAYPDGPNLTLTGPVTFSFDGGTPADQYLTRYGTKPLMSLAAGAKAAGPVPLSAVNSEWAFSVVNEMFLPESGIGGSIRMAEWQCPGGTLSRWALLATSTGYTVVAYNDTAGTATTVVTALGIYAGQITYTVEAIQSGGNVNVELFANDVSQGSGSTAGTISAPGRLILNPDQANTTGGSSTRGIRFLFGHARFVDEITQHDTPYYTVPETGVTVTAIRSWQKEPVHRRLDRQHAEERTPFYWVGEPAVTGMTICGAQQDGNFGDLTRQAVETSSGGILFDSMFGHAFLDRTSRYNQPAALVIDMATYAYTDDSPDNILVPKLDARADNVITVQRTSGVEATYAASLAYRKQRGSIPQKYELDLYSDDDPRQHAAWRTHVNTDAQEALYPGFTVDLAANPDLIDDYELVDIGSRVQRTNQPTIAGFGVIDQVAEEISEVFGPRTFKATFSAAPAIVYDVGVWDVSLWQLSLTTLQSGITTTALSMSVAGEPLLTGAVSWVMEIDGEHMTVTNVSGSGPYTLTIGARSVNGVVRAHLAGAAVTFATPANYAL